MEEYRLLSAKMYQITKPVGKSLSGDIEYYYECIKDIEGPILEVGVGNGRVMVPFLEKGLNMTGIDISEPMLAYAHKNLEEKGLKGKVLHADILDYGDEFQFDAVIIPTGTFCLFEEAYDVLMNIHYILKEDGFLLVDILLPFDFKEGEVNRDAFNCGDNQVLTFKAVSETMDKSLQTTTSEHTYRLYENNKLIDSEVSKMTLHWYCIKEFIGLLEAAEFKDVEFVVGYGDDDKSPILTFKAYK